MTTNIKSAKHAIEAELSHARKGIAYYTARVEALENALHQLDIVEDEKSAPSKRAKHEASARKTPPRKASRGHRAQGASGTNGNGAHTLPSTGGDFWLELVSTEPQSAVDIADAAITALDIKADQKKLIQKLKQRVSPALASLVSAQKIQDTGAGRERRFFKSVSQPIRQ